MQPIDIRLKKTRKPIRGRGKKYEDGSGPINGNVEDGEWDARMGKRRPGSSLPPDARDSRRNTVTQKRAKVEADAKAVLSRQSHIVPGSKGYGRWAGPRQPDIKSVNVPTGKPFTFKPGAKLDASQVEDFRKVKFKRKPGEKDAF